MRTAFIFALTLFVGPLCFGAEVFPAKPVRIVVPFSPGGNTDIIARLISPQLSAQLGKPIVVENRDGASGTIAHGIVAKSAPDGYTMSVADTAFVTAPSLLRSVPYDVAKNFTPITQILRNPTVVVVPPSLNVNTLKEFIALAQTNPGKFNYGSSGIGSSNHLWAALFNNAAKINLTHIPYKGSGEVIVALLSNQVQMQVTVPTAVLGYITSGKLRGLAVTTDGKRSRLLPDVPSMSEVGISGMTIYAWAGLVGPAGMSKEIVNRLHTEVVRTIAVPSVNEQLSKLGEIVASSPEEFSLFIRSDLQRWSDVIKTAGIKPE